MGWKHMIGTFFAKIVISLFFFFSQLFEIFSVTRLSADVCALVGDCGVWMDGGGLTMHLNVPAESTWPNHATSKMIHNKWSISTTVTEIISTHKIIHGLAILPQVPTMKAKEQYFTLFDGSKFFFFNVQRANPAQYWPVMVELVFNRRWREWLVSEIHK